MSPQQMNDSSIQPGQTIGIFGSGQLGRMFTNAAHRLGYRVHVFSPEANTPAGQVADLEVTADYLDEQAVEEFVRNVNVVTFEFENIPHRTLELGAAIVPVHPSPKILLIAQNRIAEKQFLTEAGVPCAPYSEIHSQDDLQAAIGKLGLPAVLKTATSGYDGKGQVILKQPTEAEQAWDQLGRVACVLEKFVEFRREVSVIVSRTATGETACYGPIVNAHTNHILDISVLDSQQNDDFNIENDARSLAKKIAATAEVVGVVCVEFFEMPDGSFIVNEIAPRPHNSGHLTIDACETCQFEQQVRAVCGLPLGSPRVVQPAAMTNLLGDLWQNGEPNWAAVEAMPNVHLHLYGKHEPRAGRKMGHLTALAESVEEAEQLAIAARNALATPV